jgi:predicted Zn-dependent protease
VWVSQRMGLYGEARPIVVNGRRGAELYVRPEMEGLGEDIFEATKKDPLLRDAIVYLTCVHESGHALGLGHTAAFADIMYSFGYGGDIPEYFNRYRRRLKSRADIPKQDSPSKNDLARLNALLQPE